MTRRIFIVAWLAVALIVSSTVADDRSAAIVPIPAVQEALKRLSADEPSRVELLQGVARMVESIEVDRKGQNATHTEVVSQVIYALAHRDVEERSLVLLPVMQLSGATPDEIIRVAAPLLRGPDDATREAAELVVRAVDVTISYHEEPRFRTVESFLRQQMPQDVDDVVLRFLVRVMYGKNPAAGVLTMRAVYLSMQAPREAKQLAWAEHKVSHHAWLRAHGLLKPEAADPEAKRELESLATSPRWWIRLYVAHTILRHRELSSPALIERLRNDPDPAVREVVEQIRTKRTGTGTE